MRTLKEFRKKRIEISELPNKFVDLVNSSIVAELVSFADAAKNDVVKVMEFANSLETGFMVEVIAKQLTSVSRYDCSPFRFFGDEQPKTAEELNNSYITPFAEINKKSWLEFQSVFRLDVFSLYGIYEKNSDFNLTNIEQAFAKADELLSVEYAKEKYLNFRNNLSIKNLKNGDIVVEVDRGPNNIFKEDLNWLLRFMFIHNKFEHYSNGLNNPDIEDIRKEGFFEKFGFENIYISSRDEHKIKIKKDMKIFLNESLNFNY